MSGNVYWIAELQIKPGQLDGFKALLGEMVAATKANEPGTLNYEFSLSADNSTCHAYERYADSAATLLHFTGFVANYAERFSEYVELTRFVVYGNPDEALREAIKDLEPEIMAPLAGFDD